MSIDLFLKSKEFSKLLTKGKDQTHLSPEDINDAIPAQIVEADQIDQILLELTKNKIEIKMEETEEDEEGIKFDGTEIIEEALSKEEKAELRSASTDPVKLYLKRMGSVALLTREGEVEIAKEIEEGEKEIILSSLSSSHALKEIVKLKEKIQSQENPNEFVKELVRGLDDESTNAEIKKTGTRIIAVCDQINVLLEDIEKDDGTLKKFNESQREQMDKVAETLADLTFNRKIINSFVEPVKKYFLIQRPI